MAKAKPGLIETLRKAAEEQQQFERCPWCQTPGLAEEVADALRFLCTDEGRSLTLDDVAKHASEKMGRSRTTGSLRWHCRNHGYRDLWDAARRRNRG